MKRINKCPRNHGEIESIKLDGSHVFTCVACLGMICPKEIITKEEYEKWLKMKFRKIYEG